MKAIVNGFDAFGPDVVALCVDGLDVAHIRFVKADGAPALTDEQKSEIVSSALAGLGFRTAGSVRDGMAATLKRIRGIATWSSAMARGEIYRLATEALGMEGGKPCGNSPWDALEAAQFWLQEEAASERPGQTKPDDILRVIGDALAGRPMAPLTSDLVKPDLASQLRFLAGIIGTHSQQGRTEARQTVAHVEDVTGQTLAALKTARDLIDEAMSNHIYSEDEEPGPDCGYTAGLAEIDAAIAKAEGKEG